MVQILPLAPLWPAVAHADDTSSSLDTQIAQFLHPIPTFTIVDKSGVPFMVVGEDAKVTGYFFVEYAEASRVLQLARQSGDKKANPWKQAQIATLPLDTAVALSRSRARKTYFRAAASASAIESALDLTNQTDLPEGKVPLFYYESDDQVYFDLQQCQGSNPEPPQVTELYAILNAMARNQTLVESIRLVPPKDSIKAVKKCSTNFVLGQSNIVL